MTDEVMRSPVSEQRRAEWTARIERYAESAVVKNRPFAEALVEWIAPPVGARVLDVATGPGIVAVEGLERSCFRSANPSMPGIMMSDNTRFGRVSNASWSAFSPSVAVTTSYSVLRSRPT